MGEGGGVASSAARCIVVCILLASMHTRSNIRVPGDIQYNIKNKNNAGPTE